MQIKVSSTLIILYIMFASTLHSQSISEHELALAEKGFDGKQHAKQLHNSFCENVRAAHALNNINPE